MLDDQTLVSVVLITEDASDDDVFNTFKNITEQTHRKIDIIISTFREDIDELKKSVPSYIWMFAGLNILPVKIFLVKF